MMSIAAIGCDEDPARSVKIIDRSPAAIAAAETPSAAVASAAGAASTSSANTAAVAATAARPSAKPRSGWHPDACPPPPEESTGPSNLTVKGPCAFEHRAAVICEPLGDDFIVAVSRKAANGATLVMYMNVEKYAGPGNYDEAQMFVAVQDGQSMYRWSNENVRITIGAGEAFTVLPTTRLEAEPMLVDCKRVIGPNTNYQYDCGGETNEKTPLEATFEIVSGTLQCEPTAKSPSR